MSHIAYCLSSHKWGGGELHVTQLLNYFKDSRRVSLIVPENSPGYMFAQDHSIEVVSFDFDKNPLQKLPEFLSIVRRLNPDILHTHLNKAAWYGSLSRPFHNHKVLATIHGYTTPLYYLGVHNAICVSHNLLNVQPRAIKRKASVVYNGISSSEFGSREALKASVFATIHPNKGQEFIADSLIKYQPGIKTPLFFKGVGAGKYEKSLQEKLSKLPNFQIQWEKVVGDLEADWAQTAFTIVPSFKEALSYVAIESLHRGIPVLASKTGGLAEVLREGIDGLYFEPGNEKDFCEKLLEMEVRNKEFSEALLQKPFLENRPEFKLEKMLESTEAVYLDLLNRSSS